MKSEVATKTLVISAILTLAVGILFIIFPASVINLINYIVGGLLVILGIMSIIMHFRSTNAGTHSFGFAVGLVLLVFGGYLLLNKGLVLQMLTVLFGFYILINGIIAIQLTVDALRKGSPAWKVTIISAIINSILGVIILWNPFAGTEVLVMWIGIFMTITAIINILTLFFGKKVVR